MKHATVNANSTHQLMSIPFFEGIDQDTLQSIARHCRWRTFAPDQQVVVHGDTGNDDVYFVVAGRLRVTLFAPNGREVMFHEAASGEMFGELAAIDQRPRSTFVTALSKGECMTLKANVFRGLLQMNDSLANRVLQSLTHRVRFLSDRIYEYSSLRVKDRVRAELLRIALMEGDSNSATIKALPTHTEIASRISTHREAVTRELNSLVRRGVITRDRVTVRVPDMHRLQQMIGQDSL